MNNEQGFNFLEFVTAIAVHLEGFILEQIDPTAIENVPFVEIQHADGRRLGFRYDPYNQKIKIWGRYGKDAYGNRITSKNFEVVLFGDKTQDEIKVSSSRTAEAIAKDIKRRLLPYYSEYFFKISERVAQQHEKNERINQKISEVAEILGTSDVRGKSNYIKTINVFVKTSYLGKIETYHGEDYTIELRGVPHIVTLQIALILKSYITENQ